jgi:hypothetical protein
MEQLERAASVIVEHAEIVGIPWFFINVSLTRWDSRLLFSLISRSEELLRSSGCCGCAPTQPSGGITGAAQRAFMGRTKIWPWEDLIFCDNPFVFAVSATSDGVSARDGAAPGFDPTSSSATTTPCLDVASVPSDELALNVSS